MSKKVPFVVATAPERIYLTVSDDEGDAGRCFPDDHEGICWCEDEAVDVCVPYARADLHASLTAELEALRRDAERVAFLDTVPIAIHVRNGRRYEAGPGNARDIIDMAQRYHAARQQEATNVDE